ncbi:MAG: AAA family ATPase, partial [Bacillota bacterium]
YGQVRPLAARYEQATCLYEKYFYKASDFAEDKKDGEEIHAWADNAIIEKAGQAANGEQFQRLWFGKWEETYPSQSEADLALCSLLAYWTGNDKAQIDRLFRHSELMRDKWDEKRGKHTYGEITIETAIKRPAIIPSKKLEVISATDLQNMYIPPIRWVVDGLIPQGLTMIVAPPKSGKSWLMLDLCLSITGGKQFLGRKCEKGGCLYLALEDGKKRLQDRMNRLLPFDEKAPKGFDYANEISKLNMGFQEQLEDYIHTHKGLRLVVIDTFQYVRAMTNNRNVYAQDYADLAVIKKIADKNNIGIIVVHHTKKGKDDSDPFMQISGTNALLGALDTALIMERQKRIDAQAVLHVTGRDVDMQDLIISFNKNSCKWEYVSSAEENEQEREYETYQKDMLVMTIRDLVSETGIWQGPVSEILKAGFFQEDERAIGKRLSVIEPLLMKYDGISHAYRRSNGKRLHTFRIDLLF